MDLLSELNLLGTSPSFLHAVGLINRYAGCDATVLLQGDTGTGKEVAARAIHYLGPRRDRPFVPVNCGALPDNLLETELFGYERGAFTDARESRPGMVSQAEGGTLFLDEIEVMTPRAQVVLLRVLQDHSYRPVGGRDTRCRDVRVIASSNVDLEELVSRNAFRSDLLYRLNILALKMPPLRERAGDVLLLAEIFLRRFAQQHGRPEKRLHPATREWLPRHDWPGNVRELENLMLREFLLCDGSEVFIEAPPGLRASSADAEPRQAFTNRGFRQAKAQAVADFERSYLEHLLTRTRGNLSLAARLSRKDRSTLTRLVKKHGIEISQFRI
ncbi:MAG TPA: sigma-54 dependent transcriptional regulator [Burkholderiales bacterium]|nr:sigma-54 dependent transcriptional regulator [Burkholderiales bacterium]